MARVDFEWKLTEEEERQDTTDRQRPATLDRLEKLERTKEQTEQGKRTKV